MTYKTHNANRTRDQLELAELDKHFQHALLATRTDINKTDAGYINLVLVRRCPEWIIVCETPTVELPDGWQNLDAPDPDYLVVAASHFEDRFAALDLIRDRLARVARERATFNGGTSEWFKVSLSEAQKALVGARLA